MPDNRIPPGCVERKPSSCLSEAMNRTRKRGFTLIEILVVIVVIAILATLVAPNVFQHVSTAKSSTAKSQIEMIGTALDAYRLDNGQYPTTQQGLEALITKPTIDPPATNRTTRRGRNRLSYGADKKAGGEGENADILSWK